MSVHSPIAEQAKRNIAAPSPELTWPTSMEDIFPLRMASSHGQTVNLGILNPYISSEQKDDCG